jgi:glycosyltransferase involved in cell wall biosynthesis
MSGLAACTIVSKNYLPFARVLARSFAEHYPGARFWVLLADRVEGRFDPAAEPFTLLTAEELPNLPAFPAFAFQYGMLEINTAVKPFLLEHLIASEGVERLVYLDPDIRVTSPLTEVEAALGRRSIVLTPHLTAPYDDDGHPGETTILQAGTYNLGFLGLAAGELTRRFLAWWKERTYDRCVIDFHRGLFVDQRWVDLVPGLFPDVEILTDPGYNVAYWNLHARTVCLGEPPTVNGRPLAFFHFSGIQIEDLGRVSKHQSRFTLDDLPAVRELYVDYRERLLAAGYAAAIDWPYAFARFDNGVRIPDAARALYRSLGPDRERFGDPFASAGEGSFFAWLRGPARRVAAGEPHLSRLLDYLSRYRDDLVRQFPDAHGRDLARFARWLVDEGAREHALDPVFLEPVAALAAVPVSPRVRAAARTRRWALRLDAQPAVGKLKFRLKRLLGVERARALKRRLPGLGGPPAAEGDIGAAPVEELAITRFGVNVQGYARTESGMGEGVRGVLRALAGAGVPHSLHNLELNVRSRMEDRSFEAFEGGDDFDVNLLFVNADQVPEVCRHLGRERLRRKVNVGFWLWELEEFPPEWRGSFGYFHEIWTPSRFCLDSISAVSPVPVRRVPLPVEFEPATDLTRSDLGLPEDRFVFVLVFDFLSFTERKNPLGLVRAFKRAFAPGDGAALVLKTVNSEFDPEGAARLAREAEGHPVVFLDRYLTRREVHGLLALSDCCVSLHRSEGFGLTLAEAMFLGKPVIATGYSGNTDFMTAANSFPVRHRLVPIERDHGPYRAGWRWAEPDEEHAAEQMRAVFADRELARRIGERAREDVRRELSNAAIGRILRRRLERIVEQVNGRGGGGAIE